MKDKRRNLIFCLVSLALCGALLFLPGVGSLNQNPAPREKVRVLSVDNSTLQKIGIVYADTQRCRVEILTGKFAGTEADASNYMNSALDKDNLFLSCDGRSSRQLVSGDNIEVTLSPQHIDLVSFGRADQFQAIDKKLKKRK